MNNGKLQAESSKQNNILTYVSVPFQNNGIWVYKGCDSSNMADIYGICCLHENGATIAEALFIK